MIDFENLLRDETATSRLSRDSLLFFDSPDLDYTRTLTFLKKNPDFEFIDSKQDHDCVIWDVRFRYRGLEFLIETNHHGTASMFIASDPNSPTDTLVALLSEFESNQRLTWDSPSKEIETRSFFYHLLFAIGLFLIALTISIVLVMTRRTN